MRGIATQWSLLATLLVGSITYPVHGRAFEVRLLKGDTKSGTWGTDEFQLYVNETGIVRNVTVRGKELIWQAAALYTSPVPAGQKEGVRTVQGEGFGERGLSVIPPTMECGEERGRRIFTFRHLVSNKKVLDGKPLCQVDQSLIVTPTGEIHVTYDCHWLETVSWGNFSLLIFLAKEGLTGSNFVALSGEQFFMGSLVPGGDVAAKRVRGQLERLTIWSEVGPFHYVFDSKCECDFSWHAQPQLSIKPSGVPYRNFIYKGLKDRIAYRILLPVSQQ